MSQPHIDYTDLCSPWTPEALERLEKMLEEIRAYRAVNPVQPMSKFVKEQYDYQLEKDGWLE